MDYAGSVGATMKFSPAEPYRNFLNVLVGAAIGVCLSQSCLAQNEGVERTFSESKATVDQAWKAMQSNAAGRLPVLDGFAAAVDHPLEQYRRGYYQSKIQVSSTPSGGSTVHITVEVTAWYNDPTGAHSGYAVLNSNGRLEADILDQLADQLASKTAQAIPAASRKPEATKTAPATVAKAPAPLTPAKTVAAPAEPPAAVPPVQSADRSEPSISAPVPRLPDTGNGILSSLSQGLAEQPKKENPGQADDRRLQAEADSLQEILKNQAHPKNLVAVKKDGTAVVAEPSLNAKAMFLASAHDEFEMLDFNQDWVHIRVSGISRGWIWRNSVEMPASIPDTDLAPEAKSAPAAADVYRVSREEQAPFPGDWAPLRGKIVKIVTVEKSEDAGKDEGPQMRLSFAKSVLDKNYSELAQSSLLGGIVLIFDSADGGMIAASLPILRQWKAGTLSDAALWHQCFFDPPESFTASASGGSPSSSNP
jgi:hypothetical protein